MLRIVILLLALPLHAASPAAGGEPVRVAVSILPQEWLVGTIGGDDVEIMVLVGPGHSPATYEPTASQMARLLAADVFFSAGVPFEKGLLPRIAGRDGGPRVRGPRHASGRDHPDLDPHTWLSGDGAAAMVDTMRAALTDLRPDREEVWRTRSDRTLERIGAARLAAREILAGCEGAEFFVFHPAFGHFARDYGLVQVAVEDHGHEPGPRHLAETMERARAAGARVIVVQPQFSKKSAAAVAATLEAEVLVLDPLATPIDENILEIARTLARVVDCGGEAP